MYVYYALMRTVRNLYALVCLIVIPVLVVAHGGAESFEKNTGRFFVDIGYDVPLQEAEESLIDIALFSLNRDTPDTLASFTSVTLRIHSGSIVLYERSVEKPPFGKAFVTVTPEEHGNWTLTAEFSQSGSIIETASFSVLIKEPNIAPLDNVFSMKVIIAIIIVMAAVSVFAFRRRHNNPQP